MSPRKQVAICPNPKCGKPLPGLLATCHEAGCLAVETGDEAAAKRREDQ